MKIRVKVSDERLILDNMKEFVEEDFIDALWLANYLGQLGVCPDYHSMSVPGTVLKEVDPTSIHVAVLANEIAQLWKKYKTLIRL